MSTTTFGPTAVLEEVYLQREARRLLPYKDIQISTGMPGMVRIVIMSQDYKMDVPIHLINRDMMTTTFDNIIEMIRTDLPFVGMEWHR